MKPVYWFSLILILLMTACGGTAVTDPEPAAADSDAAVSVETDAAANEAEVAAPDQPALITEYVNQDAGFSLALPDGWVAVESTAVSSEEVQGAFAERGVSTAFLSDEFIKALLESGLQFYAIYDEPASTSSEVPVSLRILRQEAPVSMGLDELVTGTTTQLAAIIDLTSEIEQTSLTLAGAEAAQISYSSQQKTPTDAEVHTTQYYLIKDDQMYIITLEMGNELVDQYLELAETAVETFQLTD